MFWGGIYCPFYWHKQQIKITHLREKFLYGRFCERKNGKFALKLGCRLNGYNFDKGKVEFAISEEVKVVDVLFVKISWLHWSPWHYRVFDISSIFSSISELAIWLTKSILNYKLRIDSQLPQMGWRFLFGHVELFCQTIAQIIFLERRALINSWINAKI